MIPLGARIITVADCFDTMVSARAYKPGRSIEQAMDELRRCSGTQFDPKIVDAFARSLDTSPAASEPSADLEEEILN
jgi:HD-GYP domain-containing protein (c-di-GMP phosphodiesterase class II)